MGNRDDQLATLQHPTLDLQLVVRERLAVVLRKFGYTDVIEPADKLLEISEENDDTH